jgi:hypothetical protein
LKGKWNIALPVVIMLVFAVTRWPGLMPPNFSVAYALAFCAGVYFPGRWGWIVPLVTLLGTDILMNHFYYGVPIFTVYLFVNTIAYCGMIWLGRRFSPKNSWFGLLGGGFVSALIFYFVSNTAAWLYDPAYPKTLAGWIQALTTGTPGFPHTWEFFRNTFLSGGLFAGLFAGAMKLSEAAEEKEEEESEEETAPDGAEAEA